MPTTVTRYAKALLFGLSLLAVGLLGVPRAMDAPARNAVQAVAKAFTGMPYLFGYNATESVDAIIERVARNNAGRITRQDVPAMLTEVIRQHRPDFSQNTVQFVTEAAFNLAINMLPQEISDPAVLTPILSLAVPRALSSLAPARQPPRYPELAGSLFKSQSWLWISVTATVFGWIALAWGSTRKILSPQDEAQRTRTVNAILGVPYLLLLAAFGYHVGTFQSPPPAVGIFSAPLYAQVTAWISLAFVTSLTVVYFGISLGVYLLPYFVERVSVLAVWRRLVFPPATNLVGDLLHYVRQSDIVRRFAKMLFQHFAREIAP